MLGCASSLLKTSSLLFSNTSTGLSASTSNIVARHLSALPIMTATTPKILFVWDFDWTVINCNSDEYVPVQFLGENRAEEGFHQLYNQHKDWHKCVEGMVNVAITEGNLSTAQILAKAAQMPYLMGVRTALDTVHSKQGTITGQLIVSDGNTLFIQAFLDNNDLSNHFNQGVVTNIGRWEKGEDGKERLRITHQSQQYGGHSCKSCPKNLCKTQALSKILDAKFSNGSRPRIVYVGDGGNDACPALHALKQADVLLARAGKRRAFANERKGAETDEEATSNRTVVGDDDENDASGSNEIRGTFGIFPALAKAKHSDPPVLPKCEVLEWRTGDDLKGLVKKLLEES